MSLTIDEKTNNQKKEISLITQSMIQMGILLVLSFIGIFIIILVLFILIKYMPGSPYMFIIGEHPTEAQLAAFEAYTENWGLDKPIISQYFIFLWNMISGYWGESLIIRRGTLASEMIIDVFPRSFELNFISFSFTMHHSNR